MSDFVHLHLHSEYSLLDGACRISDIPAAAIKAGHSAVALTDHGCLFGAVKFYKACRAAGVKPIIGCEVYVARRTRFSKEGKQDSSGDHLVLLAKNEIGYRNLIHMVSLSYTEGFYSRPRVDMDLLREHAEGLIALSGCIGGRIPRLILEGDMQAAESTALEMRDMFGDGAFYLEVQDHGMAEEKTVRSALCQLAKRTGIPLVAANDPHYISRSDAETQAVLMCIQTGSLLSEGRPFGFLTDEYYYKSTAEMQRLFADCPEAVENTVRIAEQCNFDFTFGHFELPVFKTEGETPEEMLRRLSEEGFGARLAEGRLDLAHHPVSEYRERMDYELSVIHRMGFDEYYLVVRDFIRFAKSEGIPVGPGRGSGAGSLVAWFVGITDVDSLKYQLLFERFLNPERISMPDFDTDFCYSRRDEVIAYVRRRYGEDHVAQIVTFGTLAARAAVRDVGRVLSIPYKDVDEVARLIPRELGITLADAMKRRELRELYDSSAELRRMLDIAMALEGMPRHASTHAAGVVITDRPVREYVPLSVNGDAVVTEYDMDAVAELGLVKFDFLGLRYLTILSDAEKEIKQSDPSFDLNAIPEDDAATYKMLASGDTSGVFQLESGGMRQMLMQLQPTNLEEITAAIALYRPGPMDAIPTFIARKFGREQVTYAVPALQSILSVTYGCIVYQEQVMQIFRALADYSLARADLVRRAMSKKKAEVLEAERASFLQGCSANGIARDVAGHIFDEMESFAKYAFNKSHATAYAILTYRTAYLKKHYPAAYYCALLSSVLGNAPKISGYVRDAARVGIRILPPDVNESHTGFRVCGKNIRFGLLAVKNIGLSFVSQILNEREKGGAFRSFSDFIERMAEGDLNCRQVEYLIKSGAFDVFGLRRSQLLSEYEKQVEDALGKKRGSVAGQLDMFSVFGGGETVVNYPDIPEFSAKELLLGEKESTGMYFSGHLLDEYAVDIASGKHDEIGDILAAFEEGAEPTYTDRSRVTICGMITAKTVKTTKAGAQMAILRVEDRYAEIEVLVFPKQYEASAGAIREETAVRVVGTVSERDDDAVRIHALSVSELRAGGTAEKTVESAVGKTLYLRVPSLKAPVVQEVLAILKLSRGTEKVLFYDTSVGKYVAAKGVLVDPKDMTLGALRALLGAENVVYQ